MSIEILNFLFFSFLYYNNIISQKLMNVNRNFIIFLFSFVFLLSYNNIISQKIIDVNKNFKNKKNIFHKSLPGSCGCSIIPGILAYRGRVAWSCGKINSSLSELFDYSKFFEDSEYSENCSSASSSKMSIKKRRRLKIIFLSF